MNASTPSRDLRGRPPAALWTGIRAIKVRDPACLRGVSAERRSGEEVVSSSSVLMRFAFKSMPLSVDAVTGAGQSRVHAAAAAVKGCPLSFPPVCHPLSLLSHAREGQSSPRHHCATLSSSASSTPALPTTGYLCVATRFGPRQTFIPAAPARRH